MTQLWLSGAQIVHSGGTWRQGTGMCQLRQRCCGTPLNGGVPIGLSGMYKFPVPSVVQITARQNIVLHFSPNIERARMDIERQDPSHQITGV